MKRRSVIAVAAVCVLALVGGALAWRALGAGLGGNPILASVTIGQSFSSPNWPNIDPGTGKAYFIDDGVADRVVTVQGNGYSWSGPGGNSMTLRVIDTRNGRLMASLPVSADGQLAVDPYTHRFFTFAQPSSGQIQVFETRHERLLATVPYNGDPNITAVLADARSGRLFLTTNTSVGNPTQYEIQHVLMLDGHSGKTLRVYTYPSPRPSSQPSSRQGASYITPPFSVADDGRLGRLYVFNGDRLDVLDTTSGRRLYARHLPMVLTGVQVDEATGRIFAIAIPWPPPMTSGPAPHPLPQRWPVTMVMLDPRTGAVSRRLSSGSVSPYFTLGSFGIDGGANRVLEANSSGHNAQLRLLDGTTGRVLHTVTLGGLPYQVVADAPRHRAMALLFDINGIRGGFGDPSSRVAVLDTRTGALLRTIALPRGSGLLALDPGTGHLILASSSILDKPTDPWSWLPSWLRSRLPAIPAPSPTLGPSQRILHTAVITLDPAR